MEYIIDNLNNNEDPFEYANSLTVEELEKTILYASDKYYNKKSIISDAIWDMLVDFLRYKKKNSKVLTQIGSKVKTKNKVKLPYFLGSMDKIKPTKDKLASWKSIYKGDYVLSEKLDGVSGLLLYSDNTIKLYTRGTSTEGTDITNLLKYMANIPTYETVLEYCKKHKIKGSKNLIAFRGEIIMSKKTFEKKWSKTMSNSRNTIIGLVNSKTINPTLAVDARFVGYEVVDPRYIVTEQYRVLKDLGFYTVHSKIVKDITIDYLSKYLVKRKQLSKYTIDGIIVTNNELHKHNVSGNPEYAFAFKDVLEEQKAVSKVIDIEWKVSKDGYIVPTVIIEPVSIGGVTIKRVTGENAKNIKDNMISPGAVVEIIRSGDVIPKIEKVLTKAKKILYPDMDYEWNSTGVDIVIKNKDNDEMEIMNLYHFFSSLDTKGLGEKNIIKLYNASLDSVEKILTVTKEELMQVEGFKDKMAENLLENIKNIRKSQPLDLIMKASNKLGRGIGIERARDVLDKYPNIMTEYVKWSKNEFIEKLKELDGWEEKTSSVFVENFPEFVKFYNMLKKYIDIYVPKKEILVNGKYKNMNIVMSGFRDKDIADYIVKEGGKITNTISKNTNLLIIKDKSVMDTTKVKKAQELGIKIITKNDI